MTWMEEQIIRGFSYFIAHDVHRSFRKIYEWLRHLNILPFSPMGGWKVFHCHPYMLLLRGWFSWDLCPFCMPLSLPEWHPGDPFLRCSTMTFSVNIQGNWKVYTDQFHIAVSFNRWLKWYSLIYLEVLLLRTLSQKTFIDGTCWRWRGSGRLPCLANRINSFCSKILGGGGDLWIILLSFYECRFNGGAHHEVVGTLKAYYMLRNLFELIALKGSGDAKTLGTSAWAQRSRPSHLVKLSLPNI